MQNNEAQAFLWEKYTTFPHVEQGKCRYVGDVVTPWPCFVIAARTEIAQNHPELLAKMCAIVNKRAQEIKNDPDTAEMISWRYNIRLDQVEKWLAETEWNYNGIEYPLAFEKAVQYLKKLHLIEDNEAENWREKMLM